MHATDKPRPLLVRLLVGSLVALLIGACSGGGQASSAAPASAEPLESPTAGNASPVASASTAGLPIHHVYDLAYARSVLPATAVGVDPGTDVLLDVYAPDAAGPWPIVIWAPGGEETKLMGQPFGEAMASRGAVVFVINTVHSLDPTVPPLGLASRGLVDGAACAVRTARALAPAYGGDPAHVVWSGHSLGGVYGFELALADPDWEQMWTEHVATCRRAGPDPRLHDGHRLERHRRDRHGIEWSLHRGLADGLRRGSVRPHVHRQRLARGQQSLAEGAPRPRRLRPRVAAGDRAGTGTRAGGGGVRRQARYRPAREPRLVLPAARRADPGRGPELGRWTLRGPCQSWSVPTELGRVVVPFEGTN